MGHVDAAALCALEICSTRCSAPLRLCASQQKENASSQSTSLQSITWAHVKLHGGEGPLPSAEKDDMSTASTIDEQHSHCLCGILTQQRIPKYVDPSPCLPSVLTQNTYPRIHPQYFPHHSSPLSDPTRVPAGRYAVWSLFNRGATLLYPPKHGTQLLDYRLGFWTFPFLSPASGSELTCILSSMKACI